MAARNEEKPVRQGKQPKTKVLGRGQPWHRRAVYNLGEEPASPPGQQRPVGSGAGLGSVQAQEQHEQAGN